MASFTLGLVTCGILCIPAAAYAQRTNTPGVTTYGGCITGTSVSHNPAGAVHQFTLENQFFTLDRQHLVHGMRSIFLKPEDLRNHEHFLAQLRMAAEAQRQTYVSFYSVGTRAGEVANIAFKWKEACRLIKPKPKPRPKPKPKPKKPPEPLEVKAASAILSILNAPSSAGGGGFGGFLGWNTQLGEADAILSLRVGGLYYPGYELITENTVSRFAEPDTVNGLFMVPALVGIKLELDGVYFYPEFGVTFLTTDVDMKVGISGGFMAGFKLQDTRISVGVYVPDLGGEGDQAQTSLSVGQDF